MFRQSSIVCWKLFINFISTLIALWKFHYFDRIIYMREALIVESIGQRVYWNSLYCVVG